MSSIFRQSVVHVKSNGALDLLEMAVLATTIAGLLYFGYFQLAPWIWSQNLPFKPEEITPWVLPWLAENERDGIELYALYALMYFNLLSAYALTCVWDRLAGGLVRYLLALPLVAVAWAFIGSIGFHPPLNTLAAYAESDILARSLTIMTVVLPVIALLYYLQQRSTYCVLVVSAILLIPVCFLATGPINWLDYQYILIPALRLLRGDGISEIYFQYDLLLSLIGLAWLKLRLDPNLFQIAGQCSYYLLLFGVFSFSRKLFLDKRLPVFFLTALVLMRIYSEPYYINVVLQVTPLRLDLWLILLVLVYFKGPYHWSAGLFCGLMLLLHKNFGIIYSAAYFQLLLTLCVIDAAIVPGKLVKTASLALKFFLKKNYRNLILILVGALAHYFLFSNANQGSFHYARLGLGFMKIATNSFYWYAVVVSGLSFILLFRLRAKVSVNYLAAGFCLIYLMIGNSLYFFGRSHENAIILLSPVLLLLFFLLLDYMRHILINNGSGKLIAPFIHRNITIIVSLAFIASITLWYGDIIIRTAVTQARNIDKGQLIYPSSVSKEEVLNTIAEVKSITGDNPKVYFVSRIVFLYDYYGDYAPVGYYNPLTAWVQRREFNMFLQGLLDKGYYLVVDNDLAKEVLQPISISSYGYTQRCVVAWK